MIAGAVLPTPLASVGSAVPAAANETLTQADRRIGDVTVYPALEKAA